MTGPLMIDDKMFSIYLIDNRGNVLIVILEVHRLLRVLWMRREKMVI